MNGRKNYGGQQPQGIVGPSGIPLMLNKDAEALEQQRLEAEDQARIQDQLRINQAIVHTGQQIYVALVARDLKPLDPIDPEVMRSYAAAARAVAPYYVEAMGLINVKPVAEPESSDVVPIPDAENTP